MFVVESPDEFGIAVMAVIESGFTTIITGLPSLSLARTRNDSGMTWMSVNPAFDKDACSLAAVFGLAPAPSFSVAVSFGWVADGDEDEEEAEDDGAAVADIATEAAASAGMIMRKSIGATSR